MDLAELYALQNKGPQALEALEHAEWADPNSILAVATRAQYEQQFGNDDDESKVELERAETLSHTQRVNEYDGIALCRAMYYRDKKAGLGCLSTTTESEKRVDTQVEHARWLIDTGLRPQVEAGIVELRHALAQSPRNIKANYVLARALSDIGLQRNQEVREHYLSALDARAFTDDDFTDQGNAAAALSDVPRARALYNEALRVNPRFAYAYLNLSLLHKREDKPEVALHDLRIAKALHPRDLGILDTFSDISEVDRK